MYTPLFSQHRDFITTINSHTASQRQSGLSLLSVMLGLLIAVVLFFVVAHIFTTPGLKPVIITYNYKDPKPIIAAEPRVQNIGEVTMGDAVSTEFFLYNKGGTTLHIHDVDASCGCTVTKLSKKNIAPGDFSVLTVDLDTSLKSGKVVKEIAVHSNDPNEQRRIHKVYLMGNVNTNGTTDIHENIDLSSVNRLALFEGKCASCHVDKGIGKSGKELFAADCAMCHGMNAQGRKDIAPSLLTLPSPDQFKTKEHHKQAQDEVLARFRTVISKGATNNPQMPPFHVAHGGPLNNDDVDSLINFLRYQNKRAQKGTLSTDEDIPFAELEALLKQGHGK